MKTIYYSYTFAPPENKILMKHKLYSFFFFLFCLAELFPDNLSPVFLPGVYSNFDGFDLGFNFYEEKRLYYVLSN